MGPQENKELLSTDLGSIYDELHRRIEAQAKQDEDDFLFKGFLSWAVTIDSDIVAELLVSFDALRSEDGGEDSITSDVRVNLVSQLDPAEYGETLTAELQRFFDPPTVTLSRNEHGEHLIVIALENSDSLVVSLGFNHDEEPPATIVSHDSIEALIYETVEIRAQQEQLSDVEKQQLLEKMTRIFAITHPKQMPESERDESSPTVANTYPYITIGPDSERTDWKGFTHNVESMLVTASIVFYFLHEFYEYELRQKPIFLQLKNDPNS